MASLRPLPVFALNRDGSVVSSSVFRGDSSVSSWRGGMLRMGLRGGGAFLLGGLVVKGSSSSTTSSLCSLQGGKVAWGLDLQEVERRVRDGGPEVHRFGVQEESGAACVRLLHPQAVRYVVMSLTPSEPVAASSSSSRSLPLQPRPRGRSPQRERFSRSQARWAERALADELQRQLGDRGFNFRVVLGLGGGGGGEEEDEEEGNRSQEDEEEEEEDVFSVRNLPQRLRQRYQGGQPLRLRREDGAREKDAEEGGEEDGPAVRVQYVGVLGHVMDRPQARECMDWM